MKSLNKFFIASAILVLSFAQVQAQAHSCEGHSMHSKKKMEEAKQDTAKIENIVRMEAINLNAIDKNQDGKVFQDVMDFNVISDTPGTCPLCKMVLKEVTLDQAKANLTKAGFKTS